MFYSYHNESRPQVRVDFTAHAQQAIARADEVACDIARSPMDFRFQEKSGHATDIAPGPDLTLNQQKQEHFPATHRCLVIR